MPIFIIKLFFFSFRSIRFEYDQETTVDGALGYRYKMGHKLISNKTDCESNECFNPQPSDIQVKVNLKQKKWPMNYEKSVLAWNLALICSDSNTTFYSPVGNTILHTT